MHDRLFQANCFILSEVGSGASGFEQRSVTLGRSTENSVRKRKPDLRVVELFRWCPDGVLGSNRLHLHNLQTSVSGSVSSGHVRQKLLNSTSTSYVTELL